MICLILLIWLNPNLIWLNCIELTKCINFLIDHIYWEGNTFADKIVFESSFMLYLFRNFVDGTWSLSSQQSSLKIECLCLSISFVNLSFHGYWYMSHMFVVLDFFLFELYYFGHIPQMKWYQFCINLSIVEIFFNIVIPFHAWPYD